MNSLFLRKLSIELSVNYIKQSLISYKTIRQLYTSNNHVFRPQNNYLSLNKWQPIKRSVTTSQEINLFVNKLSDNFMNQKRFKKGKKGPKREAKEDSDEEESEEEEEQFDDTDLIDGKAIGFTDVNATLVSLRLDNVLKTGLNMARNKVEEMFYNNMIRVNGYRVSKKSTEVVENDEIDLIKGFNKENKALIDVNRVVIKRVEDKLSSKQRIRATLRKFRNLTINNYKSDPYRGGSISSGAGGADDPLNNPQ